MGVTCSICLPDQQAGDLAFCHSRGLASRLIRLGEWIRLKNNRYNHVAVLQGYNPDTGHTLVWQAEAAGVTDHRRLCEIAPGGTVEVVAAPWQVFPHKVVAFMRQETGAKYGFLSIAAIALDILTPSAMDFRKGGTWICSAVAGEALRFGGWLHPWPSIYEVMPQQLYDALTA